MFGGMTDMKRCWNGYNGGWAHIQISDSKTVSATLSMSPYGVFVALKQINHRLNGLSESPNTTHAHWECSTCL